MSLESGHFTIYHGGSITSRNRNEDQSSLPKGIFNPAEADPGDWELEKLGDGRYILKCRGSPTGIKDGRIVAYVNWKDQDKAVEWNITRQEPEGLYLYAGSFSRCLLLLISE